MHSWLLKDEVNRWYGKKGYCFAEVKEKYIPRINGEVPTLPFLILCNGEPIGYIQCYRVVDYPDYNKNICAAENTASIDLFIGEDEFRHRGLGASIITKFLQSIVFKVYGIDRCIIAPDINNLAAIKCYKRVGFKYIKNIRQGDSIEYLMEIREI